MKRTQILLLLLFFVLYSNAQSLQLENRELNIFTANYYSIHYLKEMIVETHKTKELVRNWILIEQKTDTPKKNNLKTNLEDGFPDMLCTLEQLSVYWNTDEQNRLKQINSLVDTLIAQCNYVMNTLKEYDDYDDPMKMFEISPVIEEDGMISELFYQIEEELILIKMNIQMEFEEKLSPKENFVKGVNCD